MYWSLQHHSMKECYENIYFWGWEYKVGFNYKHTNQFKVLMIVLYLDVLIDESKRKSKTCTFGNNQGSTNSKTSIYKNKLYLTKNKWQLVKKISVCTFVLLGPASDVHTLCSCSWYHKEGRLTTCSPWPLDQPTT